VRDRAIDYVPRHRPDEKKKAQMTKTYRGIIDARENRIVVVHAPKTAPRELPLRLDLADKSAAGFAWGFEGDGTWQLAIAIAADIFGDVQALALAPAIYLIVSSIPIDAGFTLTEGFLRRRAADGRHVERS
jgi:hypothetical protein